MSFRSSTQYIYLADTREYPHISGVFKVGGTDRTCEERISEYPVKKDIKYFSFPCDNCWDVEELILEEFNKKFVKIDKRREYFKGNLIEMFDIIHGIIRNNITNMANQVYEEEYVVDSYDFFEKYLGYSFIKRNKQKYYKKNSTDIVWIPFSDIKTLCPNDVYYDNTTCSFSKTGGYKIYYNIKKINKINIPEYDSTNNIEKLEYHHFLVLSGDTYVLYDLKNKKNVERELIPSNLFLCDIPIILDNMKELHIDIVDKTLEEILGYSLKMEFKRFLYYLFIEYPIDKILFNIGTHGPIFDLMSPSGTLFKLIKSRETSISKTKHLSICSDKSTERFYKDNINDNIFHVSNMWSIAKWSTSFSINI